MTATLAVSQQLVATQQRAQALERLVHTLTAENNDLASDLYRGQQNRPPETEAGKRAVWFKR